MNLFLPSHGTPWNHVFMLEFAFGRICLVLFKRTIISRNTVIDQRHGKMARKSPQGKKKQKKKKHHRNRKRYFRVKERLYFLGFIILIFCFSLSFFCQAKTSDLSLLNTSYQTKERAS